MKVLFSSVPYTPTQHPQQIIFFRTGTHRTRLVCTLTPLLLLAPAERALMRASAEERAVELEPREEQTLPPLEAGT